MLKIGIIGYGYWGPNLVRNFSALGTCIVKRVSDQRQTRLDLLKKNYPSVESSTKASDIINDPEIDAVVIATPVFTHYDFALQSLKNDKHVLIEKPMTSTSIQARRANGISRKER
jgi:predicted dehydrogenase